MSVGNHRRRVSGRLLWEDLTLYAGKSEKQNIAHGRGSST